MNRKLRYPPAAAARRFLRRWLIRLLVIIVTASVMLILPLRWLPPLTTSFMVITWANKADDTSAIRYRWVPRQAISRRAPEAVIAAEDQKFFDHIGFDLQSIGRALRFNQRSRRTKGASTITQQLAKNLFLWPGRSWTRKGIEAWITVWLEILLPKERILELYLNVAQFGPTVFGVEAASQRYFGKPALNLNREESALLAAVLPNPQTLSVARPSEYVLRRQAWILYQAARLERNEAVPPALWR